MTYKAMTKRLDALETQHEPQVIGFTGIWEPAGMVQLCALGGDGEQMTLDEWHRRYADGLLIRVVYSWTMLH